MCFEVFLKIFVAVFSLFGAFCLIRLVFVTWFGYDNVRVAVEVDSAQTAENIGEYVKEAETLCLLRGGGMIAVIIRREFYDEKLVKWLERRKIKIYVV